MPLSFEYNGFLQFFIININRKYTIKIRFRSNFFKLAFFHSDFDPNDDLVLDGSDSFTTRALVGDACIARGLPLVAAALGRWG